MPGMKRFFLFLAVAASAFAADPSVRVILDLNDNSRLLGQMPALTLSLDSPELGKLAVALERVSVLRVEHTGVQLLLRNGDRVAGSLAATEFRVMTTLGELTVPLSRLRRLETLDAEGVPASLGEGLVWRPRFATIEKNKVRDASGNGIEATVTNAKRVANHRGKADAALAFDLKSKVEARTDLGKRLARQISVCGWVKLEGAEVSEPFLLIGWGSVRRGGGCLGLVPGEGLAWTPVSEGNTVSQSIDLSGWTFVVATHDGLTASVYLNGVQTQTMDAALSAPRIAELLVIGGNPTAWSQEPAVEVAANAPVESGEPAIATNAAVPESRILVDEVRVYERALNADEVRALYEATK
jgi:hypothetical protein